MVKLGNKKYDGFLIDADNTIFDFERGEREAFLETMSSYEYQEPLENAYLKFKLINQYLWKDLENKKIRPEILNIERFKILKKTLNLNAEVRHMAGQYLDSLSKKVYIIQGTLQVLEYLSRRASLCLITNGLAYVQRNRIARAELEVFFNSIIISEEIGYAKPDKNFFKMALTSINLPPYKALCIGDSPSADIRGGHNYGLDTCWFIYKDISYPLDEPIPDYIISDFEELKRFAPEIS